MPRTKGFLLTLQNVKCHTILLFDYNSKINNTNLRAHFQNDCDPEKNNLSGRNIFDFFRVVVKGR